jgi:hypothetical protein
LIWRSISSVSLLRFGAFSGRRVPCTWFVIAWEDVVPFNYIP